MALASVAFTGPNCPRVRQQARQYVDIPVGRVVAERSVRERARQRREARLAQAEAGALRMVFESELDTGGEVDGDARVRLALKRLPRHREQLRRLQRHDRAAVVAMLGPELQYHLTVELQLDGGASRPPARQAPRSWSAPPRLRSEVPVARARARSCRQPPRSPVHHNDPALQVTAEVIQLLGPATLVR